jgi:hypothetical protein
LMTRPGRGLWVPKIGRISCDLLIFVEQSAESITPEDVVDLGCCALGEWPQGSGLAERAVWPAIVVVEFVLAKYGRGVRWLMMRIRSRSSRRMVPTNRSAMALARGARTGVRIIWMPLQGKTASNVAVNLASRSWMRNRNRGRCHRGASAGCGPVGSAMRRLGAG